MITHTLPTEEAVSRILESGRYIMIGRGGTFAGSLGAWPEFPRVRAQDTIQYSLDALCAEPVIQEFAQSRPPSTTPLAPSAPLAIQLASCHSLELSRPAGYQAFVFAKFGRPIAQVHGETWVDTITRYADNKELLCQIAEIYRQNRRDFQQVKFI